MTPEQIERLSNHQDPDVRELVDEYLIYHESAYSDIYRDLAEFISEPPPVESYDYRMKFFKEIGSYVTNQNTIRGLMNPEKAAEIEKEVKQNKIKQKEKDKHMSVAVKV